MLMDPRILIRSFSPRIVAKVLATLDRSTAFVISAVWLAALVCMILAVFAVHGAVTAQREASEAIISEPVLPEVTSVAMTMAEMQKIVAKLQRQFPDIKIEVRPGQGQAILVKSDEGIKFHQWITALSYIDTTEPQYRWKLRELCTGTCGGGEGLMSAVLSGQRIAISVPRGKKE